MEDFIIFLEKRIGEQKADIEKLEKEGRGDEADFARVRSNIYDIARSVTLALKDRSGYGTDAVRERFEGFRRDWGDALEKAREKDDAKGTAVGENRLAALEEIIERFREVCG